MKTLYLHIGLPKTATSSIQAFLVQNQEELNRNNYCYPVIPFLHTDNDKFRNAHFMFGYIFKGNERCYDTENQYRNDAYNQIAELFKTYDNIILSSESLWNNGFRADCNAWERLQTEMAKHNFTTKVIVYLRRQDEFLHSWWAQKIRTEPNFNNSSWDETLAHHNDLPLLQIDYFKMLERICPYVGKENIIIRRFGKQYFKDQSIFSDFLDCIGLEYTESYSIKKEMYNLSLTKNSVEIKRNINQIPGITKKETSYFLDILVRNSEKKGKDTTYTMYTKESALALYNEFQESNRKIAREYLNTDDDLFEFEFEEKEKWTSLNEEMISDLISFMTEAILLSKREIDTLNKELTAVKKELEAQKKQSNYILNLIRHPIQAVGRKLKRK